MGPEASCRDHMLEHGRLHEGKDKLQGAHAGWRARLLLMGGASTGCNHPEKRRGWDLRAPLLAVREALFTPQRQDKLPCSQVCVLPLLELRAGRQELLEATCSTSAARGSSRGGWTKAGPIA
ncbi:hypothetical protein NDU88_008074 [Pleurodeles waltl]|uniref:Uncharacterized protein n=1 Tax=Pleurodeles waltl TaxID=8319 RepID=A0AAV7PTB0_PLEWA|nr:hypothetical protein NDU88_008074 [Pleurodeles waltl]